MPPGEDRGGWANGGVSVKVHPLAGNHLGRHEASLLSALFHYYIVSHCGGLSLNERQA